MRVAVAIGLPSYQAGLAAALGAAGFEVAEVAPEALPGWWGGADPSLLVLWVGGPGDLERLREAREARPDMPVVVVTPDSTPVPAARALRAGATAVVPWDASPEEVIDALRAAARGHAQLPVGAAWALAGSFSGVPEGFELTPRELDWLRQLARGHRVAEVAKGAGYSPRHMGRLLGSLVARMGAADRAGAVVLAARWGLLED